MISPETALVVGVAALVIFGGRKLPELGRGLGEGLRAFKRGVNEDKEEEAAAPAVPVEAGPVKNQQP